MKFYTSFDEEIYRTQMKLNFALAWGKSKRANKQTIFLMTPLLLFGLFTWAGTDDVDFGLILASLSGCLLYLAISGYQQHVSKRKEYLKLVEVEIKEYKANNTPALFEFQEDFVRYKNHKYDLQFKWSAFTQMTVIDRTLVLSIHALNALLLSEEEIGKDNFVSVVARCEAKINQNRSDNVPFNF